MALSGGLVAGIRAGLAYKQLPAHERARGSAEIFSLEPWYLNFFSNMATVQFDHRLIAWLLAFLVPWFWLQVRRAAAPPRASSRLTCSWSGSPCKSPWESRPCCSRSRSLSPPRIQAGALLVFSAALFAAHSLR